MARTEARIKTSIWTDNDDFRQLGPDAQWLYLAVLSQPTLNLCGVLPWSPRRIAELAKGLTVRWVTKAAGDLGDMVAIDVNTEELWVRTFLRHDRVLDKPNVIVAASREYNEIHSRRLRERILDSFAELAAERFPQGLPQGLPQGYWERLGEPFREGLQKGFPQLFPEPIPQLFPQPFPEPSLAHALCAHSAEPPSSILHPPSTTAGANPSANPSPQAAPAEKTDRTEKPLDPIAQQLADRWLSIIAKPGPLHTADTRRWIPHLLTQLDPNFIDETIGRCHADATNGNPPRSIKYLVAALRQQAATHLPGLEITDPPDQEQP